ncbi:hypothetical protein JQ621_32625 [Bradyrhizobium manausense]|uniref:hypothetical protein n=1 Tax=Bradyrhizobium manausense TaxID=989370 RepID=UPI001BAD512E|nr:hypothetical protein [Bradyrhizobium manausense]MBR1092216.1 hypothetical protein [Bradyrhizobium manausense]
MQRLSHSISKVRLAAISLTAAAGLLVTAYLAGLEWRLGSMCPEFRSVDSYAAQNLWYICPWIVMLICQCAMMRWTKSGIAFYASFVLSLIVVLIEIDELAISGVQGVGLWMPDWAFCDRWIGFDLTLSLALLTGYITAPFAGVLGLATVIGLSWSWFESSRLHSE